MFLPRRIILANLVAATLLAPVAVQAIGLAGPSDTPPMARAAVAVPATPALSQPEIAPEPAAPKCRPVRVIYPGHVTPPACPPAR